MKKTLRRILSLTLILILVSALASTTFAETWYVDEDYDDGRYIADAYLKLEIRSVLAMLSVLDDQSGEYITNAQSSSIVMTHKYYPEDGSALQTVTTHGHMNSAGIMQTSASYSAADVYRIRSVSATYSTTVPASYSTQTFTASKTLEQ